jgi:plastocyanin domain-containing protein
MFEHITQAWAQPDGERQVVDVAVHAGYRPEAILARAGVPLRIRFCREDDDPCTERVVFSRPRVDRRLAMGRVTVVDLPAQPAGEIRFTCGMGRYRGRIELRSGDGPPRPGPLWISARHRVVAWLASLPLVAGTAFVLLDGPALPAVVGFAVVGWLAAGAIGALSE